MQQENIRKYLNNLLSEEERFLFEQEIENDDMLREEVAFQREMFAFFEQREDTNNLQTAISESANNYFNEVEQKKRKFPYIYLWGVLGVLILFGIGWFIKENIGSSSTQTPVTEEIKDENTKVEETLSPLITTPDTSETIEPIDLSPIKVPKENIPNRPNIQDTEEEDDAQPIADASIDRFQPNPTFESILESSVRANNTFELNSPKPEQVFEVDNDEILFVFNANTDITTPISIAIYDNAPSSFDNDSKSLYQELTPKVGDDDQGTINWSAKIPFQKGLYYYVIRNVDTNEMLHTDKFFVR